jgi:hypothetical protein
MHGGTEYRHGNLFEMPRSAACRQYLCTMASILVLNSTGPGLYRHCFAGKAEVVQEASRQEQCDGPTVLVCV